MSSTGASEPQSKAHKIFLEAVELPVAQRQAYLDNACRDDRSLQQEVQSLLESYDQAGSFLEQPLLEIRPDLSGCLPAQPAAAVGSFIGPYEILEKIGEGGMGTVYRAFQKQPVLREVALKVVKPGLDSREVTGRFELERQALAVMNHPSIAGVLDAGTTSDGRPYFVMEHVSGQPITAYCDSHRFDTRSRLLLFVKVCRAVQHAHQKGIIHRDLKPSNILVTSTGDGPTPKIIDFGVARIIDPSSTWAAMETAPGIILGTPEYMSPEQAEIGFLDLDTRTDVYSLGVLLYELITGKRPFEPDQKGYAEILRKVREESPPAPSRRVLGLKPELLDELAARRATIPSRWVKQVRGELDWITMKAMDKDRACRFSSASELAADILRFLDGEPVLARPPTARYLLRKFMKKRKGAVSAVLTVFLALAVGLTLSVRFSIEAKQAQQRADELLGQYRNLADLSLIKDYLDEAERLWPAWPENVQEMERWVAKAERLADRRALYSRRLAEVRAQALPDNQSEFAQSEVAQSEVAQSEVAQCRAAGATMARLEDLRLVKERLLEWSEQEQSAAGTLVGEPSFLALKISQAERQIAALERSASSCRAWRFATAEEVRLHDRLSALVEELQRFADPSPSLGAIAAMRSRIERARTLAHRVLEDDRESWQRAISSIANPAECPAYRGLAIQAQNGLIPLARNTETGFWEFLVLGTGEAPQIAAEGRYRVTGATGIVLVLLPGGTFTMGAVPPQPGEGLRANRDHSAWLAEGPVHEVALAPFFLSKYEMTRGQWRRLSSQDPSLLTPPRRPNERELQSLDVRPASQVYWQECRDVLLRLGMDLPTEAQWEYAARAGTGTPWYTGFDSRSLIGHANLRDSTMLRRDRQHRAYYPTLVYEEWLDDGYIELAPVGCYLANPFGLYDVLGNASEWCRDWFQIYQCPVRSGSGERIAVDGGPKLRIVRGGHSDSLARGARVSARHYVPPTTADFHIGLRPMRPLVVQPP